MLIVKLYIDVNICLIHVYIIPPIPPMPPIPPIPPIPPMPGPAGPSSFGISVTTDSAVVNKEATPAASVKAVLTT